MARPGRAETGHTGSSIEGESNDPPACLRAHGQGLRHDGTRRARCRCAGYACLLLVQRLQGFELRLVPLADRQPRQKRAQGLEGGCLGPVAHRGWGWAAVFPREGLWRGPPLRPFWRKLDLPLVPHGETDRYLGG